MSGLSSLWNKNDVDWDNPQKYRTSYIIRELYQATYELYYIAYMYTLIRNSFPIPTPEDYNYKNRDEEAVYDICSMLNRLFADDPQYTYTRNSSAGYMATGCFIEDDYIPSGYPESTDNASSWRNVYFYKDKFGGMEVTTLTKLEGYYGDMSFIRDYGTGHRIGLDFIHKVRSILSHPFKLNTTIAKPYVNYSGVFQGYWSSQSDAISIFKSYGSRGNPHPDPTRPIGDFDTVQEAVDAMKVATPHSGTNYNFGFTSQSLDIYSCNLREGDNGYPHFDYGTASNDATPVEFASWATKYRLDNQNAVLDWSSVEADQISFTIARNNSGDIEDDYGLLARNEPYITNTIRVNNIGVKAINNVQPFFGDFDAPSRDVVFVGDDNLVTTGLEDLPVYQDGEGHGSDVTNITLANLIKIDSPQFRRYYTEEAN